MGKKKSRAQKTTHVQRATSTPPKPPVKPTAAKTVSTLPWMFPVLLVTAIALFPMLKNDFTNWDDEFYVIQNSLLRGPDWRGIFSNPVVSNYHPLTVLSLAINYGMTGLDASSYLIFNYILHLINTALVFYFIYLITNKNLWVSLLTALIFGIHPMHVESVAWVSERKDVLYTLFFMLSLIQYWRYLQNNKNSRYWLCFLFFILSLLSKPAAIVLPLVLLLLDYWKGRPFNKKTIFEKIPFFLLSIVFAVITVNIQSKTAIAGLDFFPLSTRLFFACYAIMIYFLRFFIPYPLSAFHPFPPPNDLGTAIYFSPIFIFLLLAFLWYYRKNKVILFGFGFFVINLLLVIQIISVGATIVSERYTYVPYIGLGFLLGTWLNRYKAETVKKMSIGIAAIVSIIFGLISFQRTQVWKNSQTLWTNVINQYPNSPVPRTNRANDLIRQAAKPENADRKNEMLQMALEDCNESIKVKPNHAKGYENRQNIYLTLNKETLALADAAMLIQLEPNNRLGYYTKGVVFLRLNNADSALRYFNKVLEINPNIDYALNNRGTILLNYYKKYNEAKADFTKAIEINPQADYYLNRSICYYYLGDINKAREDASIAAQKGKAIPPDYKNVLKL